MQTDSATQNIRSREEITDLINKNPMSLAQVVMVGIAVAINMLDGFDVLVMAFTASAVAEEWSLSSSQLGILLSAGLFGMAAGSLFLAPLADKLGRRMLVLICLVILTVGMFLSAFSQGPLQLTVLRIITGIGIGGMLASLNVITAEYSNDKWRSFCLTFNAAGYSIGAVIGGSIAVVLLITFGWRSVFMFGALCSAIAIPLVMRLLPESLDFLMTQRREDSLDKVNKTLRSMGHPNLSALPEIHKAEAVQQNSFRQLFDRETLRSTLLLWTAFFMVMFSFYFIWSWTPRLLTLAGLTAEQGVSGGVALSLGGIFGSLLLGYLATWWSLQRILAAFMVLTIIVTAAFTQFYTELAIAMVLAVGVGFLLNGCMSGLYALGPTLYPATSRGTGMGWGIGIGRLGAILSPLIAGWLLDLGWETSTLYYLFTAPLLISMAAVLMIKKTVMGNT